MRVGGWTDKGPVRSLNEDAWAAGLLPDGGCWGVVLDALGGITRPPLPVHRLADALGHHLRRILAGRQVRGSLLKAVLAAANRDFAADLQARGLPGYGATGVLAVLEDHAVTVAWIGDCRAWVLRSGSLHRLTEDHTLGARLRREGQVAEGEAHPHDDIVVQALGPQFGPGTDGDSTRFPIQPGDRVLLASDGVWRNLDDAALIAGMSGSPDPALAAQMVINAAIEAGTTDNCAAVVLAPDPPEAV